MQPAWEAALQPTAPSSCGPPFLLALECRWEGSAGIDLKLHGFSHKLPLLAAYVFKTLASLAPPAEAFARVKEQLTRSVSVCEGGSGSPVHLIARLPRPPPSSIATRSPNCTALRPRSTATST